MKKDIRMLQSARMKAQEGVMLLEALIAIMLFSIGIVAVMGMQAAAISQVTQSKFRTDASYLANQIIGKMWTDQANLAGYTSAGSAQRVAWDGVVSKTLPNGGATITLANRTATVTVTWKMPEETVSHKYVAISTINLSDTP